MVKKLNNWIIDKEWIQKITQLSTRYDTISFDIFDTALTRDVDSPVDIFAIVEKKLIESGYPQAKGFAEHREDAERLARQKRFVADGAEDITLSQIYAELPQFNKHFTAWDEAQKTELAAEQSSLHAVPDILEFIQQLQQMGKEVIFVSDMYLPSAFLKETLLQCGYANWDNLIVSNEVNATKSSGKIWTLIKQDYKGEILHIGDDEWSDVQSPRAHGIASKAFVRTRSERRTAGALTPKIIAFSKATRRLTLQRRGSLSPTSTEAFFEDFGRSYGALVVGSFLQWVVTRAKLHDVKHLYFCARDGYLLQQAWNQLNLSQSTGITSSYLEIARRPLNLARGYAESQPHLLDPQLLDFLCSTDGTTTVGTLLKRIDLDKEAKIVESAITQFGSLESPIRWPDGATAIREIFNKNASTIYQHLAGNHDRMIAYLRQEGLFDNRKAAIIDMGWHGTMQRSLEKLIDSTSSRKNKLIGFYYGLWPKTLENIYAAGLMETAFANMFIKGEDQAEVQESVEILEELHSAPHGTVLDYNQNEQGQWSGLMADSPLELQQFKQLTQYFQYGVTEELKGIFHGESQSGLTINDLSTENAIGAMGMVALSPSKEELKYLMKIGHCPTFDHLTLKAIIPEKIPETTELMYENFWRINWRIGLLHYWLSIASDEQRRIVIEIATHHLPHQHRRTKQIFI